MKTEVAQPQKITVDVHQIDEFTAKMRAGDWQTTLAITGTKPVGEPKPTEALIGALAACMISGLQRESMQVGLKIDAVEVSATGLRLMKEEGPLLTDLHVLVIVTSPEKNEKLMPILEALKHNGTVTNTLQLGQEISIEFQIRRL